MVKRIAIVIWVLILLSCVVTMICGFRNNDIGDVKGAVIVIVLSVLTLLGLGETNDYD